MCDSILRNCNSYRIGKVEEALTFAQSKLSEAGEDIPDVLNELERTLALLAFEKPQESPFAYLLEQSHRHKVITMKSIIYFNTHVHLPSFR